jgi:O-antigen ligase
MKSTWITYQVLIFLLPLPFGSYPDWAWSLFCAISFYICISEISNRLSKNSKTSVLLEKLELPKEAIPVGMCLAVAQLWSLMQYVFGYSLSPHDTILSVLKGAGYSMFFIATIMVLDSKHKIMRSIWIILLAASFQAFYGSTMVFTGLEYGFFTYKEHYIGLATGTFVNRNHFAGYLEMSIALGIGAIICQTRDEINKTWRARIRSWIQFILGQKGLIRLLLVLMVIGLVLSRSRMGNTAMFASLAITAILALILVKSMSKSVKIMLVSILVIDILVVGTFFGIDKVAERIQQTSSDYEQRDEITRDTISMWREQPIWGVGAGAFIYSFPPYKSADFTSESFTNHAHNDYAQFLAEFGVPVFIVLLSSVLYCLWLSIRAMKYRKSNFNRGLGFSALMGMLSIGIHSTVDFNLQVPSNAFMFCYLMAISVIAFSSNTRRNKIYSTK